MFWFNLMFCAQLLYLLRCFFFQFYISLNNIYYTAALLLAQLFSDTYTYSQYNSMDTITFFFFKKGIHWYMFSICQGQKKWKRIQTQTLSLNSTDMLLMKYSTHADIYVDQVATNMAESFKDPKRFASFSKSLLACAFSLLPYCDREDSFKCHFSVRQSKRLHCGILS